MTDKGLLNLINIHLKRQKDAGEVLDGATKMLQECFTMDSNKPGVRHAYLNKSNDEFKTIVKQVIFMLMYIQSDLIGQWWGDRNE